MQELHHVQDLAAAILADYDAGGVSEAEADARFAPATVYLSLLMFMLLHHKPSLVHQLMATTRLPGESDAAAAARCRTLVVSECCPARSRSAGPRVTPACYRPCPPVQPALGLSEEQLQQLMPIYAAYCERVRHLGAAAADARQAMRSVQEVSCVGWARCTACASLATHSHALVGHCPMQQMLEAWHARGLSAATQQYLSVYDATRVLAQHSTATMLFVLDFMTAVGELGLLVGVRGGEGGLEGAAALQVRCWPADGPPRLLPV